MTEQFKYLICLPAFLLISVNGYCQPGFRDSTEAYNYWVQRGITELIYSSMEDYPRKLTEAEQKGKETYKEKFINGIDSKSFSDIEQGFRELEQFLKENSYGRTSVNFLEPLKNAYEQKKPFDDNFFTIPHNYDTHQNWDRKKTELMDGYNKSLNIRAQIVKPVSKLEIAAENIPLSPERKPMVSGWILVVIGLFAGLFSGAFLIYYYSESKIYSILKTEKRKYLSDLRKDQVQNLFIRNYFKYIGIVAMLKNSKDRKAELLESKKDEILQMEIQNKILRTEIEEKEEKIASLKTTMEYQTSSGNQSNGGTGKSYGISGNKMEIYFTIPERDGSFKTVNAKNDQGSDCFYRIEPDKSGQKGKLYFIPGDFDLRALDNIDYYLNPVCEIQNISDRTFARKIVVTNPGYVARRGDFWKIEENNKVKIKLV